MDSMSESASQVASLIERLGRIARSAQHAEGMKPAQWETLRFLAKANKFSRTPGALADYLSSTRGTASQTLNALEKKGLITRIVNSGDARVRHLKLTRQGQAILARDPLHVLEEAVPNLGDDPGLEKNLEQILRNIINLNGNHLFGICRDCRFFKLHGGGDKASGSHCCMFTGEVISEEGSRQICREHESRTV